MPTKDVSSEVITSKIFIIRGRRIMLDTHLAQLYGVPTKSLNLAVRRNLSRFPKDFMFQLNEKEVKFLRFQFETSKKGSGGRRYLPYVFTQEGVAMLSSVLRSQRAVKVNISIMRAFVQLREILSTHKKLAKKLNELEKKYDSQFQAVFEAIRQLMAEEEKPKTPIGFHAR